MKKTFVYWLLASLLLGVISNASAGEKIAWFKSGSNSRFWPVVENIMQATAQDLGIDLDIHAFNNDPVYLITLVKEVLSDPKTRPDCIIIHNYKKRGERVLQLAEEFEVPLFLFNAGFGTDSDVGKPRSKYPHWIGQMLPDDEYGGYILAKELIQRAKRMDQDSSLPLQMVALEGNRTSEASVRRVAGLKRALTEHSEITVNQYYHSKWKVALAKEAFYSTQHRYPNTTIFWTASESMAIGVIEAARQMKLLPGKDFITGGFDLLPENKQFLETDEMAVSVGGHYFEGAWALVLIHDYLNGVDFIDQGKASFTSKMIPQTSADFTKLVDIFTVLDKSNLEKINFKQFSRFENPELKKYNFDLELLLQSNKK